MSDLVPVPPDEESQVPAERPEQPAVCQATTPQFTVQQKLAMEKAKREADIIRDAVFPAALASAVPVGDAVGASGWKMYRDRLLKEAGDPQDPVEIMMLEQLALAHFRIAQLHSKTEAAKHPVTAKSYASAAVRLTGEFRRLALALRLYRQPTTTKHFTVVRQQNLAGNQQIAYLNRPESETEAPFN